MPGSRVERVGGRWTDARTDGERARGWKEREAPRGGAVCERLLMHRLVCLSDHLTAATASKAAALSSLSVHISAAFE